MSIESVRPRARCIDYTAPISTPAGRPGRLRRRSAKAMNTGAVRLDDLPPPASETRHLGKAVAALLIISGGILATTASIGTVVPEGDTNDRAHDVAALEPTIFFDDATDALGRTTALQGGAEATASSLAAQPVIDTDEDFRIAPPDTAAAEDNMESTVSTAVVAAVAESPEAAGTEKPEVAAAVPAAEALPAQAQVSTVVAAVAPSHADEPSTPVGTLAALMSPESAQTSPVTSDSRPIAAIGPPPAPATDAAPRRIDYTIAAGDTLSGVLNDHGVGIERMPALLADPVVADHLSQLSIGQVLQITRLQDGSFHSLETKVQDDLRVTLRATSDGFDAAAIELPLTRERVVATGQINQSLYLAAEAANLKQSTIMSMADIFQWELDFARDIRHGDRFAVVYDRLYREGEYVGDGDILAAEFIRGGRTYQAIRYTDENGDSGYYAPDGTSKKRTFLRHPVDVVRITSKFDPNRLHPVLHKIRAHRGVDYGAAHGSPIRATADGVVKFSGPRSTYGNTVILQHGDRVKTLYAHMSRISDKSVVGKRVKQGDVIGYVGKTGRDTGTHLHYEFRVDEEHVDPLTVELPAAAPLDAKHLEGFRVLADEMIAAMEDAPPPSSQLATGPEPQEQ